MTQSAIADLHKERSALVERYKEAERRYLQHRLSADDEMMMLYQRQIKAIEEQMADLIRGTAA